MALEDQYGIGKGEAQVFDLQPLVKTLGDRAEADRKRHAKKVAERATKAATLNALDDKLKVEGHHTHSQFLQENLDELRNWATEKYATGGEDVFVKDPKAKAEWEGKINNFVGLNQASKNIKTSLQAQIDRSMSNEYEMERADVEAFNEYMSLPLDEQMKRPLPTLGDRELTAADIFTKEKLNTRTTSKVVGYAGKPDPKTGRIMTTSGKVSSDQLLDDQTNLALNDPESPYARAAYKEAAEAVLGEGFTPQFIKDENGEKVDNPEFLQEVKEKTYAQTRELFKASQGELGLKTTSSYAPERASEDKQLKITEISEDERGYVGEKGHTGFKKNKKYSNSATDSSGKTYFKLKVPLFTFEGKTYTKEDLPDTAYDVDEIKVGSWIEPETNEVKDEKELTISKETTKHPVTRENTIQNSVVGKVRLNEKYLPDGTVKSVPEGEVVTGQLVGYHEKNVNISKGKLVHEDEKGYNPKAKTNIKVATIETKDGDVVETKVTDQIRDTYKEEFKDLDSKALKATYKIKGKSYTGQELVDMGYTTEQIEPYKSK